MNFDYSPVALKFRVARREGGDVFLLSGQFGDEFRETAGLNSAGLFAAVQLMFAHFEIRPQPEDALLRPFALFWESLGRAGSTGEVRAILGARRLAYDGKVKGHQLYADALGSTLIVEPGTEGNVLLESRRPFTVMTNFPNATLQDGRPEGASGVGADRYRTAWQQIARHLNRFEVGTAFEVLQSAALAGGSYTTLCSMVLDPQAGVVHLALHRRFDRLWRARLRDRVLEPVSWPDGRRAVALDEAGVLASQLE